jgi:hypothetical protein
MSDDLLGVVEGISHEVVGLDVVDNEFHMVLCDFSRVQGVEVRDT